MRCLVIVDDQWFCYCYSDFATISFKNLISLQLQLIMNWCLHNRSILCHTIYLIDLIKIFHSENCSKILSSVIPFFGPPVICHFSCHTQAPVNFTCKHFLVIKVVKLSGTSTCSAHFDRFRSHWLCYDQMSI